MRNSSSVITGLKGAPRWVDDHFVHSVLDVPLLGKLNQPIQVAFFHLGVEPTFVEWVEVVADMHELSAIEHVLVLIALDVGTDEAAHPVIGYAN